MHSCHTPYSLMKSCSMKNMLVHHTLPLPCLTLVVNGSLQIVKGGSMCDGINFLKNFMMNLSWEKG